jgi:hypothetical protein
MLRHRMPEAYFWIVLWLVTAIVLLLMMNTLTSPATLIAALLP